MFVYENLEGGQKRFISNRENEVLVATFDPSKKSEGLEVPLNETINVQPLYFDYKGES